MIRPDIIRTGMAIAFCLFFASASFAADIYDYTRRLGQSVNLGNALEAPNEGEWGITLRELDFQVIADGGFDSIRVPIRWSNHAADQPTQGTYAIDNLFFDRIDWVVDQAQQRNLAVILNVHHYDELVDAPDSSHRDRFISIWEQVAQRYRNEPNTVYFELFNEPHGAMSDDDWNGIVVDTLATVRQTNPDRPVVIGGTNWSSYDSLDRLRLPDDDRNLIGTFHYYLPFQFTHQGAEWVDGADAWLGTIWTGTPSQKATIESHLDRVVRWATQNDRPVYMGEFGAYSKADTASRSEWTEFVVQAAEARGIPWSYWEFGAGFGVYDRVANEWVPGIYDAMSVDPALPPPGFSTTCDFNTDTLCNAADLDLLTGLGNLRTGVRREVGVNEQFDLNGDGRINVLDLDKWLSSASTQNGFAEPYLRGDANLDGYVDVSDFNQWNNNNFTLGRVWSDGDFDNDGDVDIVDLQTWNRNRFTSISRLENAAQVPEPSSNFYVLSILVGLGTTRLLPNSRRVHPS